MKVDLQIANIIFVIGMLALILSVAKTLIDLLTYSIDSTTTKSRLKQFNKGVKKDSESTVDTINSLTESIRRDVFPKIQNLLPSLKLENLEQLDADIKFIGWDDTFTAESYVATNLALRVVGLILGLLLFTMGGYMILVGLVFAGVCCFLLDYMFKAEVKGKNEALFKYFPDLVRIISGYLVAGMDLVRSMENSVRYVSEDWQPIINQFILDCNTKGTTQALDIMASTVNTFEVREFVSLVKLTMEQGGDAKEAFASQADKVAQMQKDQFILKIGGRKTMATMIQMPMLLCNMAVIAIPTMVNALGNLQF